MDIDTTEEGNIIFKDVFNSICFQKDELKIGICERDFGYDLIIKNIDNKALTKHYHIESNGEINKL